MHENIPIEAYRAAYDQAEQELRRIQNEFEQLCVRHDHIARVVKVLKPEILFDNHVAAGDLSLTSRSAGLSVVTRLAVMEKLPEA